MQKRENPRYHSASSVRHTFNHDNRMVTEGD